MFFKNTKSEKGALRYSVRIMVNAYTSIVGGKIGAGIINNLFTVGRLDDCDCDSLELPRSL